MGESFRIETEGHLAWLILDRAEKRNAMTWGFFADLGRHLAAFDADPMVRVVVVKAEGKMFTAGLDLAAAGSLLGDGSAVWREGFHRQIGELQAGISAIEKCRKPVIAAVHGHCLGGGVDLLCACDIRLASVDALFSIRETRLGIVADLGTLQRLPHLIGQGRTAELALTGRDFTAAEAFAMGFITRLCPGPEALFEEAKRLAGEIAALPPLTVQGVKEALRQGRDQGVQAGLAYVARMNAALIPSDDMIEAIAAFLEKRQPTFKGR